MQELKPKKSASELENLIMDDIGALPECKGLLSVTVIGLSDDEGTLLTWYVDRRRGLPERHSECDKAIRDSVARLQVKYDLAADG